MIVGIDLGTTNSLVAVWRDDAPQLVPNALGSVITPSVVGLDDQGLVLVGQAARERLQTHPQLTAALFKRHMGSAQEIILGKRRFRPEELSALVLRSLKEDVERVFGEPVEEAVISVPAYFSDAQRKATRIAGELAGLKVDKLVNEPTAAALAYGVHQKGQETSFLVFDLGGGTFDVSILELFEGVMEVRASAGDNFLGGEDFDTALVQHFVASQRQDKQFPDVEAPGMYNRLRREAERVRHALGLQPSASFSLAQGGRQWALEVTLDDLQRVCAPLLERLRGPIERALRDARIRVADLDEILLVGGTTRMPLIRKLAATLFGRFPAMHVNPDEAVALGAAVQAALKQREAALEEVVLTDVCPYTLGIETTAQFGRVYEGGHYLPIIERNSVVPVSRVKTVQTLQDSQTRVLLQIYQGESRLVKDNIPLGELDIPVPPRKAGEVKLDVRFTYDNNGILEAEVTLPESGARHSLVIEKNPGVLTPEEIRERLAALAQLKVHPRDQLLNTTLLARLERLYQEHLGDTREALAQMAGRFQQVLGEQDPQRIDNLRASIEAQLDELERSSWR
ncbi:MULTISPECIES: molecular chaperone HscC [Pseudomonas]|jgi:molecular chaperone HscC|uniref:molecular chaperone HscC n=1 Tax=Pseudomonas TaxID=286 RepID=UPI0002A35F9C|nr:MULTISPECIES: molecular chaperone HscC [Pseudomonas]KSW26138.1 2-alkenal reductase [Pseudomonas sp. ADP]AMO74493.1 Chaperone protein HscC [Pseudomonas citronellolis]KWR84067.1 molecular chaperone HscC [Pseudomonas sp. PI1]MBB1605895.1 molecular chaperone HscC [Pseudomonas sp. UMC76]MBB1639058.1 molecular chaperone HscC [Pseudomonas sp. UME83]